MVLTQADLHSSSLTELASGFSLQTIISTCPPLSSSTLGLLLEVVSSPSGQMEIKFLTKQVELCCSSLTWAEGGRAMPGPNFPNKFSDWGWPGTTHSHGYELIPLCVYSMTILHAWYRGDQLCPPISQQGCTASRNLHQSWSDGIGRCSPQ